MRMNTRVCLRCKGEGTTFQAGFTWNDRSYPDETKPCHGCQGEKVFPAPDFNQLFQAITTTRGASSGKRRLRSSPDRKTWDRWTSHDGARAYYVWRIARFHGGKDTTMPVMADLAIRSDPWAKELDQFACAVAKVAFGTDLAAALVWGKALGILP